MASRAGHGLNGADRPFRSLPPPLCSIPESIGAHLFLLSLVCLASVPLQLVVLPDCVMTICVLHSRRRISRQVDYLDAHQMHCTPKSTHADKMACARWHARFCTSWTGISQPPGISGHEYYAFIVTGVNGLQHDSFLSCFRTFCFALHLGLCYVCMSEKLQLDVFSSFFLYTSLTHKGSSS